VVHCTLFFVFIGLSVYQVQENVASCVHHTEFFPDEENHQLTEKNNVTDTWVSLEAALSCLNMLYSVRLSKVVILILFKLFKI